MLNLRILFTAASSGNLSVLGIVFYRLPRVAASFVGLTLGYIILPFQGCFKDSAFGGKI